MEKNYFLGLDIGTDSIGWAVTDEEYNILKAKGKALWGIHLFEPGQTAEERRSFRTARRRRQRAVQRKNLLREFFAEEINKVDSGFFERLDDSFFVREDKKVNQTNTLFNDENYDDKQYFKDYPTIYHLRKALIESNEKFDIRLVYLAVEHILKHRGHFLYGGADMESAMNFSDIYSNWCGEVKDVLGEDVDLTDTAPLENVLKTPAGVMQKKKALKEIYGDSAKSLVELLGGASVSVSKIFGDAHKDSEVKNICFKGDAFEKDRDNLADEIGEDNMHLLEMTKSLYDWGVLAEILKGEKYISAAKAAVYDKHAQDLKLLKTIIQNCAPEKYEDVFKSDKIKGNYASYAGVTKKGGKKLPVDNCEPEDFYKYIKKILDPFKENDIVKSVLDEIEARTFMPKQVTKDNSVIPYQVHLTELKKILKNASRHYAFLNECDKYGTVAEKIESLLSFRIPYYVGPLNAYHKKYAWIEKKSDEPVRPWNFYDIVDTEESAEKFIKRMLNKCTYIPSEYVLAKNSVLYQKYMVFNYLNNFKVNGAGLTHDDKMAIYKNVFLKKQQPKLKDIEKYLSQIKGGDVVIDKGITPEQNEGHEVKCSMKSYIDFRNIIGDKADDEKMVDTIIELITVLGDEKNMLVNRITNLYGHRLTEREINKISRLKYSGWGNFSRKLLTEIRSVTDNSNIMELLINTNENFMQIIHNEAYGIKEQLDRIKKEALETGGIGTYKSLDDLYVSPSNKKRIWRVMTVTREIVKIMGCEPKKIFIEMARGTDEKNDKSSRKKQLLQLYSSIKNEPELLNALNNETESTLRIKKLYLYYRQMGRCMYSGKRLDIEDLSRCDIDHIIPRSVKSDDSLDNTVLVFGDLNKKKSDIYPIPDGLVSNDARQLWEMLAARGFISKEKYARLTRKTPLTLEEKTDFVARQLVDTRQTTKAAAEIIKDMYPNSEIVYVKAKNVSEFRNGGYLKKEEKQLYPDDYLVKVREVNDFHHAKDAYLNIVAGNIFNEKFNHNPMVYINQGKHYNLARMFERDVPAAHWVAGHDGTINKIKEVLNKNNILYTVMPYEQRGGFFDQMLVRKGGGQFPIKTSDARYADIDKYGGYNKIAGSYMAVVRSGAANKRVVTIEPVPIYIKDKVDGNDEELKQYFESQGMENVEILVPKLKFGTLLKVNGTYVHISGRSGNQLLLCNRVQLCAGEEKEKYIKKTVKYIDSLKKDAANALAADHNGITPEKNLELYDFFIEKLKTKVYGEFLSAQLKNLTDSRDKFVSLELGEQNRVLYEILKTFQCNRSASDISLLGKGKSTGELKLNKKLSDKTHIQIINQSPTGLYESVTDISRL